MTTVKEKFILQFGEEECSIITEAAMFHITCNDAFVSSLTFIKDSTEPKFETILATIISFQCAEVDSYRKYHNITINYEDFKQFVRNNVVFRRENLDGLCLAAGGYDDYLME
jgi:hypothetical protein